MTYMCLQHSRDQHLVHRPCLQSASSHRTGCTPGGLSFHTLLVRTAVLCFHTNCDACASFRIVSGPVFSTLLQVSGFVCAISCVIMKYTWGCFKKTMISLPHLPILYCHVLIINTNLGVTPSITVAALSPYLCKTHYQRLHFEWRI